MVYLDLVIILNFIVDFLLLMAADRMGGYNSGIKHCAAAAGLGAAYAAACLFRPLLFLSGGFWRVLMLGLMAVIAFGFNQAAVKKGALFVFLSMALSGGVMAAGSGGFVPVICIAFALYLLCLCVFGKKNGKQFVPVCITYNGRNQRFFALIDSGNVLKDPLSGDGVLVASPMVAARLLDLSADALRDPVLTVVSSGIPGLRLIPFSSVGCSGGMLLAMEFTDVQIGKYRGKKIVAFSPNGFGNGGAFQALLGGV